MPSRRSTPFLIVPLGLANFLSNTLMGGLGPLDMFGGFVAGIITSVACWYLRRFSAWLTAVPIIVIPTLLVPTWLSIILHVPYLMLVLSVGIGQIAPGILGALMVRYLEKPLARL